MLALFFVIVIITVVLIAFFWRKQRAPDIILFIVDDMVREPAFQKLTEEINQFNKEKDCKSLGAEAHSLSDMELVRTMSRLVCVMS